MAPVSSSVRATVSQLPQPFFAFLKSLSLEEKIFSFWANARLRCVTVDTERGKVFLQFVFPVFPCGEEIFSAVRAPLAAHLGAREIIVDGFYESSPSLEKYLAFHQNDFLHVCAQHLQKGTSWLLLSRLAAQAERLLVFAPHRLAVETFEKQNVQKRMRQLLQERLGSRVDVEYHVEDKPLPVDTPPTAFVREEAPVAPPFAKEQAILGRKIAAQPSPLSEIKEEQNDFVVEGEVVEVQERVQKSGRSLVRFIVTDWKDSLEVKFFHDGDGKYKGGLTEGRCVRVRGDLRFDKYVMDLVLLAKDIQLLERAGRKDLAPHKRVELHCHTQMSRMDGLNSIEALVARAAEWGHPAIAVTDHGVVQAFPEAKAAAQKHRIKLILGMEGYLVDAYERRKDLPIYHVILLVKNKKGLRNLYLLVSQSHLHYFYKKPLIPKALLTEHREGLLIGTACEQGEAWQTLLKQPNRLEEVLSFYDYVEIQPPANNAFMIREGLVKDERELEEKTRLLWEAGRRLGKPVVATGDAHFLEPQHEIYRSILHLGMGFGVERQAPLYFKTTDELLKDFAFLGEDNAREVVVEAPNAIAQSVEDVEPVPKETLTPHLEGAEEELRRIATEEAKKLYGEPLPEWVAARLEKELNAILSNRYATLYIVARKLVQKSLADGYLVGSRGSVGSSLVARLCGITEVNPLPPHWRCPEGHFAELANMPGVTVGIDLPAKKCPVCGKETVRSGFSIAFEVFMGFHGDKMPDIDLNFSGEYQSRAHKYVEEIFGKDRCFRAGTISSVKDRIAYGFVKKFLEESGRKARGAEIQRLVKGCSGVAKTTGQHPGGIVILPQNMEIIDVCPVQYPADDRDGDVITTHFDYNSMHDCLVKLDVLGHDNPTSLRRLQELTGVNPTEIPLDDPETMKLFSGTDSLKLKEKIPDLELGTLGVPEFGTSFAMGMLKDTRPTRFEELVRLSGLAHGTDVWLGNAQDLIRNKKATLSTVISTRDDMLNDLVSRGMDAAAAFKIMESVRKGKGLSKEQENAMRKIGMPEWYIESCRKIKYIFPKAHAVAYCLMSFRIAYFKVHYPLAFYADYFSRNVSVFNIFNAQTPARVAERLKDICALQAKGSLTAKDQQEREVLEVAREMFARGFSMLSVDVYRSSAKLFLIEGEALRPPLTALPGLGEAAASAIERERDRAPFATMEDLIRRTAISRTVAALVREHGGLQELPQTDQVTLF